jgi:hypothetical protein
VGYGTTVKKELLVSAIDLAFLVLGSGLALSFIALSVSKRAVGRHLSLNLYAAGLLLCDGVRVAVLQHFGLSSKTYYYTYYSSDLCLVVLRYLVILSVFDLILRNSLLRVQARRAFLGFFAIVAGMSYAIVSHNWSGPYTRLILEFQQNLYFACVVLTILLCATLSQLRLTNPVLRVFVYGLGVSAALQAGGNAAGNMLSELNLRGALSEPVWRSCAVVLGRMNTLATMSMLVLWCYALTRVTASLRATDSVEAPEPATMAEEVPSYALVPAFFRAEARKLNCF